MCICKGSVQELEVVLFDVHIGKKLSLGKMIEFFCEMITDKSICKKEDCLDQSTLAASIPAIHRFLYSEQAPCTYFRILLDRESLFYDCEQFRP